MRHGEDVVFVQGMIVISYPKIERKLFSTIYIVIYIYIYIYIACFKTMRTRWNQNEQYPYKIK